MRAVRIVALVVALAVMWVIGRLYVLGVEYGAIRTRVKAPDGRDYDVLAHREGLMLYTESGAAWNRYWLIPGIAVAFHRLRRDVLPWSVTVRPAPFAGYRDLLHERAESKEAAIARSDELADAIERGEQFWAADAEWFR